MNRKFAFEDECEQDFTKPRTAESARETAAPGDAASTVDNRIAKSSVRAQFLVTPEVQKQGNGIEKRLDDHHELTRRDDKRQRELNRAVDKDYQRRRQQGFDPYGVLDFD